MNSFPPRTCPLHSFVMLMKKFMIFILLILITLLYLSFNPIVVIKDKESTNRGVMKPTDEVRKASLIIPAVDEKGSGLTARLTVELRPGEGRTLVDINHIFLWSDTQSSIRLARLVAENVTGVNLSGYDVLYSIETNATSIEGPSGGAAMAIATILAIKNVSTNGNVTITGTLMRNGNIGYVSSVIEKAKAAKDANISLFLVPHGQKFQITYIQERRCERHLLTTVCRTETVEKKVDIEGEVGIRVEEVRNIEEALQYFV